ncbi:MAG: hypothetical protein KAJ39_06315 [Gammaproteobacteria bacterium]|nr:hypothetical protein [Gammaproteobacteria bacterium]
MEDEDLTNSLNDGKGDSDVTEEKAKKPRKSRSVKKKEPGVAQEPEKVSDTLDPRDAFIKILKDSGLSKGIEIITDVFMGGEIDEPEWLDKALLLGSVPMRTRELIITRYYGISPEEMGMNLLPQTKAAAKARDAKKEKDGDEKKLGFDDIKQTQAQILKSRLEAASMRKMVEDLDRMEAGPHKDDKPVHKSVVERPLIHDGEIVMKDGVPVLERIVTEGTDVMHQQGGSDMSTMLAFMKMSKDNEKPVVADLNAKPSWAVELENSIKVNKADEEKNRIADELKREKEKREESDREHRKEIEKVKESHAKELEKLSSEITYKVDSIKDAFRSELEHRKDMDAIQGALGTEIHNLKEEMSRSQRDIKDTVVSELTKTGSKIVEKTTSGFDAVVQPMAEVARDMYKAQIDVMRGQTGIAPIDTVPETTESELEGLV